MMSHETGSVPIKQDLAFQERQWRVQRMLWLLLTVLLVAGLVGLLGAGPLSDAEASTGALTVEYQRFVHKSTPSELKVRVAPEAITDGAFSLRLTGSFLAKVDIERALPEPTGMDAAPGQLIYHFSSHGSGPAEVTIGFEPQDPGGARLELSVEDGAPAAFDSLIYP